ncbi:hypothetical protein B0H34DRAFT_229561 [Crassisporium funariophilum]|nr:hypothetical protein B0H34DRAFT_229561 [Crassisporium funariophilum]
MNSSRQNNNTNNTKSSSHSPRSSYHPPLNSESAGNGTSASKLPPTGPRAQAQAAPRVHKRPRLSEAQMSPPPRPNMHLPLRSHDNASPRLQGRDLSRHSLDARGKSNAKMEVDGEHRAPSPINRDRERNREREKTRGERERERERAPKERERDRGREWDRDGNKNTGPRRNGTLSGISVRGAGGGGPGRKVNDRNIPNSHNHVADHASRTLQERLGL